MRTSDVMVTENSVAGLYLIRMPDEKIEAEEIEKAQERESRDLPMHLRL